MQVIAAPVLQSETGLKLPAVQYTFLPAGQESS